MRTFYLNGPNLRHALASVKDFCN